MNQWVFTASDLGSKYKFGYANKFLRTWEISKNLLISSEIWLIPIAKKRLLWRCQISLIQSVTINRFNSEKISFAGESVKINWFNSEKYVFTNESVKRQITDSISENFNESDLESTLLEET